jgi:glycerol-3-phosphate acyltransferase PlsY
MAPAALAAEIVVFVGVVAWTRHISMGSIVGAATFPLAVWLVQKSPVEFLAASVIGGAFIIWKHKANIERLRAGTESVFSFGSKKH